MRGLALNVILAAAACGRVGFDEVSPRDDATAGDGQIDTPAADAYVCSVAGLSCATGASRIACQTGACITHCADMVDQPTASARCSSWGGHLMRIDNAMEQTCATTLGTGWIGLVQAPGATAVDTGWSWVQGSAPIDRWNASEPEDSDDVEDGDEQCAFTGSSGWSDASCAGSRTFLCRHF